MLWPVYWEVPMPEKFISLEPLQKAAPSWLINGSNLLEYFLSHYQGQILLLLMTTLGNH